MKTKNTTALLITSALAGGAAHGAIVYTNYNNLAIVGRNGAASFDVSTDINSRFFLLYQDANSQKPEVRGDGVNSFVLARTWQNTNNIDLNNRTYGGLPLTPAGAMVNAQMLDANPSKQQNGITNLMVQANGYFEERPDNTDADTGGGKSMYNVGDWGSTATNSGYVGLVMVNGGVTNFGWAHFQWSDPSSGSGDASATLTLIDAAYESTPNKGIQASAGSPQPPAFLGGLSSLTADSGAFFALNARVDGASAYQWQAGRVGSGIFTNLSDAGTVSGSKTAGLAFQSATSANTADYILIATNSAGAVTSAPPVTVTILTPGSTPNTADGWVNAFQVQTDSSYAGGRQNVSYQASNGHVYWLVNELAQGSMDPSSHAFTSVQLVDNKILLESDNARVPTELTSVSAASVPTGSSYCELVDMFEANGYAYVLFQQLDAWLHYTPQGGGLAKFQINPNGLLTFVGVCRTPATDVADGTGLTNIQWATSAVVQKEYVYLFGKNTDGKGTYLARVPAVSIENTNAWTYWSGSGWDVAQTNAVPATPVGLGTVRLYKGAWVSVNEAYDDSWAYVASQPQGPYTGQYLFTDPTNAIDNIGLTTNPATGESEYYYTANPGLHPEYSLASGKLLISIDYLDANTYSYTEDDAGLYKPRFYEVNLTGLPVKIDIQKAGASVVLNWTGGLLLEAPSPAGPWTTNFATSPCTNSATGTQKFYRVLAQ